jgi:hypothetical protein
LPEIKPLSLCQPTSTTDADGINHALDNESGNEANTGRIE